jgi:hypothetical protein
VVGCVRVEGGGCGGDDPVVDMGEGGVVGGPGGMVEFAPEVGPVGGGLGLEVAEPVEGCFPLGGVVLGGPEGVDDLVKDSGSRGWGCPEVGVRVSGEVLWAGEDCFGGVAGGADVQADLLESVGGL